jgi:hypothetical protein
MKYFKLLVGVILLVVFSSSCKKAYVFNPKDLIGIWTQTQPYPPGSMGNQTYIFQFTSDSVFTTSPFSTRGAYSLGSDNKSITMDCVVTYGPTCTGSFGPAAYGIVTGPNTLTFNNFFTYGSLSGPPPAYNLYMKKVN